MPDLSPRYSPPQRRDFSPVQKPATPMPYEHPKSLADFEKIYRQEYEQELASSDRWIAWAKEHGDGYGVNFHQGRRSALVFNDIKMGQILRILKKEAPNV